MITFNIFTWIKLSKMHGRSNVELHSQHDCGDGRHEREVKILKKKLQKVTLDKETNEAALYKLRKRLEKDPENKDETTEQEKDKKEYEQIDLIKYPHDPTNCHLSEAQLKSQNIVVLSERKTEGESRHIIMEGIERSPRLKVTNNLNDPDAIWVVDAIRYDCYETLIPEIKKRWNKMVGSHRLQPWKIILINFSDNGSAPIDHCLEGIVKIFKSNKYVYVATRASAENRNVHFEGDNNADSEKMKFNELGNDIYFGATYVYKQKRNPFKMYACDVQHLKYTVRNDLVDTIDQLKSGKEINRQKDAANFWDTIKHEGDGARGARVILRNKVNEALKSFAQQPDNQKYSVTFEEIGANGKKGRNGMDKAYAMALLEHKIVVVCQRNYWEDHYRLMEALTGGTLVMTDPMHPLPTGMEHTKQLIVYESLWELKHFLKYYLEHEEERLKIAKSGYEVAMKRHRSWHLMERLVFGDWDEPYTELSSLQDTLEKDEK